MRLPSLVTLVVFTALASTAAEARDSTALAALQQLSAADTNHDGNITKDELIAFRAANFKRLDRDGDGYLTKSDIPAFLAKRGGALDFESLLAQFDANHDGKVSRDEFVNGPTPFFNAADTNHDGVVTEAERQAAMVRAKSEKAN